MRPVLAAIVLASSLALLAATAPRAAADDATSLLALDAEDHWYGMLSGPAFGSATAFFALQAIETSGDRWFDHGWALAELATGLAGAAYSSWLLSGAIADERGQSVPVASWTAGAALAMNLRLVTHGALSYALWDGGTDPLVRMIVPSITVSPLEGGAMVSMRWIL